MHRVVEPPEQVDVVPTLFVVPARRVIVDPHCMIDVAVEIWLCLGLEEIVKDAQLGDFLGPEVLRIVEDEAVAIAEDVGREPTTDTPACGSVDPGR